MNSLTTSVPFPAADELRRWTLDEFGELRELRRQLCEALVPQTEQELDDLCERVAVVATELATNALRHGLPPTVVRLLGERDRLILDVADHDLNVAPRIEDRPLGAGGLGLKLTKTFAVDVGWYVGDATKHVWASFAR